MEKEDIPTSSSSPTNGLAEIPHDPSKEGHSIENTTSDHPTEDDYDYITGLKLFTVIACLTLVAFLIMLDQSIIATVRCALLLVTS